MPRPGGGARALRQALKARPPIPTVNAAGRPGRDGANFIASIAFSAARDLAMMFPPCAATPRRAPSEEESIVTQDERLAKRDALRSEIVKLEESIRTLLEKEEELLRDCTHTYAGGKSALVGGRVKVCVHCGRSVQGKDEKLWG